MMLLPPLIYSTVLHAYIYYRKITPLKVHSHEISRRNHHTRFLIHELKQCSSKETNSLKCSYSIYFCCHVMHTVSFSLFCKCGMFQSANLHFFILLPCIVSFCKYASFCKYVLFHSANMHCFILQICIVSFCKYALFHSANMHCFIVSCTESEKYQSVEKLRSFLVSGEYAQFHSQHSVNTRSFILSVLWRCTVFFSTVTHSNISSNSNISALLTTYFRNELVYEYRGPGGLVWWKK
jgi:hypothetical protein